jgi:hypothetical protein
LAGETEVLGENLPQHHFYCNIIIVLSNLLLYVGIGFSIDVSGADVPVAFSISIVGISFFLLVGWD